MNKLVWGGVATVVVVAYAGATLYARSQVPVAYETIAKEAARKFPMAQLSHTLLSRGLFSSKVAVTVKIGCGADAKEAFKFVDTLSHGPFLGTQGFGMMYIRSELVLDGEAKAAIAKAFGKEDPFTIGTKIAFDGSATIKVSSPARSFVDEGQQAQVKWGGLQSEFTVPDVEKGQISHLQFDMPELTITKQADASRFSIVGAKASMKENGKSGDMPLGKAGFSVKTIALEHPARHLQLNAQDLTIDAASTAAGDLLEISEDIGVRSIQVNARDYGPVSIKLLLKHLHIPSLLALQKEMEAAQALICQDPAASQAGVMAALQKHGTAMLAHAPEIALQTAKAKFPEGEVSLTANASVPGIVAADAEQGIAALGGAAMQKLKAQGRLTAAEAVVKYFALQSPLGEAYEKTSAAALAAGLLVRKGQDLTIEARWENGAAVINGLPQAEVMQKMQAALAPSAPGEEHMAPED